MNEDEIKAKAIELQQSKGYGIRRIATELKITAWQVHKAIKGSVRKGRPPAATANDVRETVENIIAEKLESMIAAAVEKQMQQAMNEIKEGLDRMFKAVMATNFISSNSIDPKAKDKVMKEVAAGLASVKPLFGA